MFEKIKAAFRWIYDWITVLVASLVGLPALVLELLSQLDGINITPIVGAEASLKIVTGVAIAKALLAFLESKTKARAD